MTKGPFDICRGRGLYDVVGPGEVLIATMDKHEDAVAFAALPDLIQACMAAKERLEICKGSSLDQIAIHNIEAVLKKVNPELDDK